MASTNFVDGQTIIVSSWLNDVNNGIYNTLPTKADLASPTFTGTVTAPTFVGALTGNASTATTATYATTAGAAPVQDEDLGSLVMTNGTLVYTAISNSLTIALKTAAGADPSVSDPVRVVFPKSQTGSGTYISSSTVLTITSAVSITLPATAYLGATNTTVTHRFHVYGINDSGTFRLGVAGHGQDSGALGSVGNKVNETETQTISQIAPGASGGEYIYGNIPVSSISGVYVTRIGFFESAWNTSAGNWLSPSKVILVDSKSPKIGSVVSTTTINGTLQTGTNLFPRASGLPSSTAGDIYLTFNLASNCNAYKITFNGFFSTTASTFSFTVGLFNVVTGTCAKAVPFDTNAANIAASVSFTHYIKDILNTSHQIRAGNTAAGTTTFCGQAGAEIFGDAGTNTVCVIEEIFI